MKIAFWDNTLCVRGTTVAMFDYAYYNKTLLGNESIVFYNSTRSENHPDVISKFEKEYNNDVDNYKYFVVSNGIVKSGWEYKSDANDDLENYQNAKVYFEY
jgi:uncharacterized protein with NRDE domain